MKKRSEIEEKYKWDLTKFCKDEKEFLKRLKNIEEKISLFSKYENKLENDAILFECLEFQTKLLIELGLLYRYSDLSSLVETTDKRANELVELFSNVDTKFSVATSFIEIEIGKFSNEKLKKLQENKSFSNYRRYFEAILREKKHMLSKKEEKLISNLGDVLAGFNTNFEKFNYADIKFDSVEDSNGEKHELTVSKGLVYLESSDRKLRENTYKTLNATYGKYINFLANNYICDVKTSCVFAKLRKYKSCLSAALQSEEIDESVYNMLIRKVRENIDISHKYFDLRRKALNLDDFYGYDLIASLKKEEKKYTFEEAVALIKEALSVLGGDYLKLIDRAVNERWIDVYPNENKYTGGFCADTYGTSPVILINFLGSLQCVFDLAHELGHAMHTHFSNENQPYQTAYYTIFVSEVISTTNELLLFRYLISKAKTKEEKTFLYDKILGDVNSAIFRQTMLSEFEEKIHSMCEKGEPLSAEILCNTYKDLLGFYNGDKVMPCEEAKYQWARSPHFFTSFYVYKYATGFVAASKISKSLIEDKDFLKKYINFLSSGNSSDPISLLKIADCDLTKEETYNEAFASFREFLDLWKKENI